MYIRKLILITAAITLSIASYAKQNSNILVPADRETPSKVYFTEDISPEGLLKVFNAIGIKPTGRVAVKISTGESNKSHQLSPELIAPLVKEVNGILVECNTAYPGTRNNTESHRKLIASRGYKSPVDIMDAEGYIDIPVQDTTWIPFDRVGAHIANYDFLVNLAHFKGHAMGGFGGVLKNQSIGIASSDGKALIHTAGAHDSAADGQTFNNPHGQDAFIESMAAAAQAVHNYFGGKVIYINVLNNLSIDCDCDGNAREPQMKDLGIMVSLDPVAVDAAALDMVHNVPVSEGNDNRALIKRIADRHGTHIIEYAEKIGLGSSRYEIININK